VDPDEDLVVFRDGPLDLFESENVRWPVSVVDDCSQRSLPLVVRLCPAFDSCMRNALVSR
jgi:hypothetical protein